MQEDKPKEYELVTKIYVFAAALRKNGVPDFHIRRELESLGCTSKFAEEILNEVVSSGISRESNPKPIRSGWLVILSAVLVTLGAGYLLVPAARQVSIALVPIAAVVACALGFGANIMVRIFLESFGLDTMKATPVEVPDKKELSEMIAKFARERHELRLPREIRTRPQDWRSN